MDVDLLLGSDRVLSETMPLIYNCSCPGITLPSEYVKNKAAGIFGGDF